VLKMGQKFFISFNSADRTKAHWIAWTLKEAGHEVAVHDWEIPAGGNIPLWMSTKLAWAGRLIAVVSPDYLPSRYSPMEWASQIWNDPDGTKGSVIPVIVRPTSKMPPLLEGLSRIDLTNCSEDEARRRLIEGVDMPAPPKLKPAFEKIEGEPPDSQDAGPAEKPIFVRVTELERPFLGVEVLQSGLSFTVTGTVTSSISEFKYQFINYGRTPARLTELVETWPIVNRINESEDGTKYRYTSVLPDPIDPTRQRGRTFPYGVVVSSDRPYQLSANPLAVIDVQSLAVRPWFHGEGNDLYFCGYVRYMDMFDKRYILGFCTMYDFRSGRFVLMGDDRYNYDREET
jgi:TIR domain-containing protein